MQPNQLFIALKEYSFEEEVLKKHYPWKYFLFNKNFFIHFTFCIWVFWSLLAIFAIYFPISNQQKLGRGALVVFESAFQYVVKLLGKHEQHPEIGTNLSSAIWNYEAYLFLYIFLALFTTSFYCFYVVSKFLKKLKEKISGLSNESCAKKLSLFYECFKYFFFFNIALVTWTTFALLYVVKPTSNQIGTILFEPTEDSSKYYVKPLTNIGKLTGFLNLFFASAVILFYFKYCRELYNGNYFYFKEFRVTESNQPSLINVDPEIKSAIVNSLNVADGQDFYSPNDPGFVAQLKGVNKYFPVSDGLFHALKDINLEILLGEFIVILGYSGSGKTTLLNILAGIDRPTSGSCVIANNDITKMSDKALNLFRRKKIGYIFQNYALLPNLSAEENIAITKNMDSELFRNKVYFWAKKITAATSHNEKFNLLINSLRSMFISKTTRSELDFLLNSLQLTEHKHKFPHHLSGGQQQRVAISRALIKKPQILVADEPTGAIDHSMTKSILEIFYNINKYVGTTIVLITHNPLIAQMATRVLYISEGRIVKDVRNKSPLHPRDIKGL